MWTQNPWRAFGGDVINVSPEGDADRNLRDAFDAAGRNATAARPWTVRLSAGVFLVNAPLNLPSYVSLVGAGRDATIIQRTVATLNVNYTIGQPGTGIFCDPVVSTVLTQSCSLANLTLLHTGVTDNLNNASTANPVALVSGGALKLKLDNVRLEGSWVGWYDKTDSVEGQPNPPNLGKPIPADLIGNENYQFYITNSIVIGHSLGGLHQIARRELFATGCLFMCDIRPSDVQSANQVPAGFNQWEYTLAYLKSCHVILRCAQTITFSANTDAISAFSIRDGTISDTAAYCDDCTFYLDLGDGDMNTANNGAAAVWVGGNNGGTMVTQWMGNVFEAVGCKLQYETGTITSAAFICGIYMDVTSGTNQAGDARLRACKFFDFAGSGGTQRADAVIATRIGNVQPKNLSLDSCNLKTYLYRTISGSPTWTHSAFAYTPNTVNFQRGSATFVSAATVAVTLPIPYSAHTGITDYNVALEPSIGETFWITNKTNTGFTLNSSNATSTATVRWQVTR